MNVAGFDRDAAGVMGGWTPARRARVFVVLTCLCLIGITGWRVHLARELELQESRTTTTNLARSLAEHARSMMDAADILVAGLAERLEGDGVGEAALARLQRHMVQRAFAVPRVRGLTVLAGDGAVLASAWTAGTLGSHAMEDVHLEHHRAQFDGGPFLGPPMRDAASGSWTIGVSRRFERADGGFGGVAVAIIDCDAFGAFYATFDIGAHGTIALTNQDGTLLVREPPTPWVVGKNVREAGFFRAYRERGPVGVSKGVSSLDGEMRWNSFRKVEGYPLVVFAALSEADILASWGRESLLAMTISVMIASALGVVGWRHAGQIGAQAAAEEATRRSEARYRLLAENGTDLVIQLDADDRRNYVSPASQALLGYESHELVGRRLSEVVHGEDWPALSAHLSEARSSGAAAPVTYRARRKDGCEVWLEATARRVGDGQEAVVAIRDVTRRKEAELRLHEANNQLQRLVMLDGLTGIANRRCFDVVLAKELRRAARAELPLALLLIDVDQFKVFNDLYGHVEGDGCLRTVAAAVAEGVQRPADLAARFGGEEFAVLLAETDVAGALTIGERVRAAVRDRGVVHGGAAGGLVTVSIGVAVVWPRHQGAGTESLIRMADEALYRAKSGGRDRVCLATAHVAPVLL